MKQIIQDLNSGKTLLEEIPAPAIKNGHVVILTHRSLVSLGTERMLVEFGKANYLDKVRQQPEKVKQVLDKIKSDGLRPTIEAVFRKLGEPLPLGYCNAGEVIEVAADVKEFKVGDRVVSNGPHAEIICVPKNLVAKIPHNVSYEHAVFTVIGSIGLQGIRLLEPKFGETVVVTGLGLIGLLAGQILVANGCHTIGFDFDSSKVELAKSFGIDAYQVNENTDPVSLIEEITQGQGADAVLITASTKSNDVISQSARMCRKNGKIVLVGVIGLNINRSDFYKKEISFQVSCSYGPGRYDDNYEEKGMDYPISHVRWTEKRNFQAVLQAISKAQIKVENLISDVVDFENFSKVYDHIAASKSIASIFKYNIAATNIAQSIQLKKLEYDPKIPNVGIIGAGQFTSSTVLPNLKKTTCSIASIASSKGLSGTLLAKKFGVAESTTDLDLILKNERINTVIITTRHNSHANQVIKALNSGKHVFVEKPLAITYEELNEIEVAYHNNNCKLMVGFNRRFSTFSIEAKN
jgi:threonine dehydrogenase-like Zn-dependent dehydrogenase